MECLHKNCQNWEPGITEDDCDDCCDGRYLEEVFIYASTCDRCHNLTLHELMTMDEETELGYCKKCAKEINKEVAMDKWKKETPTQRAKQIVTLMSTDKVKKELETAKKAAKNYPRMVKIR